LRKNFANCNANEEDIMEPVSNEIITSLILPLAKEWLKPESLVKSVDWLWSAAKSFMNEKPKEVNTADLRSIGRQKIRKGKEKKENSSLQIRGEIDAFNFNIMQGQVSSLMNLIGTHVSNLQHLSQQAALYGGEELAPIAVKNQINLQRKAIVEHLISLSDLMQKLYGVKKDEMNKLAKALD